MAVIKNNKKRLERLNNNTQSQVEKKVITKQPVEENVVESNVTTISPKTRKRRIDTKDLIKENRNIDIDIQSDEEDYEDGLEEEIIEEDEIIEVDENELEDEECDEELDEEDEIKEEPKSNKEKNKTSNNKSKKEKNIDEEKTKKEKSKTSNTSTKKENNDKDKEPLQLNVEDYIIIRKDDIVKNVLNTPEGEQPLKSYGRCMGHLSKYSYVEYFRKKLGLPPSSHDNVELIIDSLEETILEILLKRHTCVPFINNYINMKNVQSRIYYPVKGTMMTQWKLKEPHSEISFSADWTPDRGIIKHVKVSEVSPLVHVITEPDENGVFELNNEETSVEKLNESYIENVPDVISKKNSKNNKKLINKGKFVIVDKKK